ncbi:glycoside hydrolase family 43 protein [Streptomyces sp. ME02-8801-2C]|uniref:glycoside hydrolase family 43 protein n=1 Tax=Streptomyces sp. ME02-8801-2C TaxID=3028680 RepID=UPI0029A41A25|nr:glycoside hydrolase family 43 protein [Streptomyces sp. ME02-8801-2C]MDX3453364.1 glycoside hydrolase family 43 protein [Streptomyces sp. ME02-8801-2C]
MPQSPHRDHQATGTAQPALGAGPERPAGYLFAHFTGEHRPDGERIRFALSDDPRMNRWTLLTGIPPLAPEGGGARDPFLVRAADGSGFHLLATDLRVHGSEGWEYAVAHGSRDLLVWHSADLREWDGPHRIEVMPERAGCVWAPEAVHDPEREEYLVFWASTVYPDDDPGHESPSYQRMYYATTKDFRTFGEPRVWVDKGFPVIDSTVVEHEGWFYRFTKDERLPGTPDAPDAKFVFVERSRDLHATDYEPVARGVGRGTDELPGLAYAEGPIVLPAPDGRGWLLLLDEFLGRGYVPFRADRLDSPVWLPVADPEFCVLPPGLRHGSVLPLTEAECAGLRGPVPAGA